MYLFYWGFPSTGMWVRIDPQNTLLLGKRVDLWMRPENRGPVSQQGWHVLQNPVFKSWDGPVPHPNAKSTCRLYFTIDGSLKLFSSVRSNFIINEHALNLERESEREYSLLWCISLYGYMYLDEIIKTIYEHKRFWKNF